MKILGIETSCDETAAAVVDGEHILSNVVASQAKWHAPFGGVVPEIASRHHVENLPRVVEAALAEAKVPWQEIDGIAATYAPGLLGALLTGLQYAKGLAFALDKPFVGVHHLAGHLHAVFLENRDVTYPYLGLIVSGGHTHLYEVRGLDQYRLLGATRDDAAGEAYDKVAKLLRLGYPGGPKLEQAAAGGNPQAFCFTTPKIKNGSLDFSFSGIKTACLLEVQKQNGSLSKTFIQDLAASFQEMVTSFLVARLCAAARQTQSQRVVVTGGVAANQTLRKKLAAAAAEAGWQLHIPAPVLCTDNAAMIAYVGGRYRQQNRTSPLSLNAQAYAALNGL